MTRRTWRWPAVVLVVTVAALAATFVFEPRTGAPQAPSGPAPTPLGWTAQLQWVAGDGVRGLADAAAGRARFADPYGIAADRHGVLYVADAGDNNRIRRIGRDGVVATLAGGAEGFADGIGQAARFATPSGIAVDAAGDLYVADTGNHAIRKISVQGHVTTLAGDGTAGFRDGPAAQARFNGPVGVAVDAGGRVYVADTYNDRIRVIDRDGQVRTLAGGERPGYADGAAADARFDTPTDLEVDAGGTLWIADLRNDAIRRLSPDGQVRTLVGGPSDASQRLFYRPLSLALSHDGVCYVGDAAGRMVQVTRTGHVLVLSGEQVEQRLARPAGLAIDAVGAVYVTDAASARVHRLVPADAASAAVPSPVGPSPRQPLPATRGRWPLHPQDGWHEVVGTLGEVRGNYQGESRDHLHAGLDIRGDVGQTVLAIADAKVASANATWGFGQSSEGLAVDDLGYIHMRVGRTAQGASLDPRRFHLLVDEAGKPERVRVLRGTRFSAGDALGTLNGMAHVHLNVGASGFERNAVQLGFQGYADHYAPRIDRIGLLDAGGQALPKARDGRVHVPRATAGVQIVVEAWDQVDRNLPRRRLGLYALGYQVLDAQGTPLPDYAVPRTTIEFNRMPAHPDAVKVAYAADSGVTVHGSAITRFQYVVTNTVRDGRVAQGLWRPDALPPGDYTIRITARDYSGNQAAANRDLRIALE
ncbi:gluconolaconase [Xanthomonas sp. AmX2]|uniref:NHL repeat-containing protein n=1 Tax=Xanthomonas sp. TaxID=29446 RepID=UPI00197E16B2|nr:NHL repeat-containing protein [Xanthomonas sp.]MBN6150752.1 gluconolaconase [Xanthomonas sp.]